MSQKTITRSSFKKTPAKSKQAVKTGKKNSPKAAGANFDPSKQNYHPIDDAFWNRGEKTPYLALTRTFQLIEKIRDRPKKIKVLSNFFQSVIVLSRKDVLPCVYLCLSELYDYEGLELGVEETSLKKVICLATGRSEAQIEAQVRSTGDLGIVAEQSMSSQCMKFQRAVLTVDTVFKKFKEISKLHRESKEAKAIKKIQSLYVACRHSSEARFLISTLHGKIRIGWGSDSPYVWPAFVAACTDTPPNQKTFPPKILQVSKKLSEDDFRAAVNENGRILDRIYPDWFNNYDTTIAAIMKYGLNSSLVDRLESSQAGAYFDPSKQNYHPIDDAFWNRGEKTPYLALTRTFQLIEKIRDRPKKIKVLSNFFQSVIVLSRKDVLPCVYLCLSELYDYEGLELGVEETSLKKVICQATGRSGSTGGLGIVAEQLMGSQCMKFQTVDALTVDTVFKKFKEISKLHRESKEAKAIKKIQSLYVACRHSSEARFLISTLHGKIRIGWGSDSPYVWPAFVAACTDTPPNQKSFPPKILQASKELSEDDFQAAVDENGRILDRVYPNWCHNYNRTIAAIMKYGLNSSLVERLKTMNIRKMNSHLYK